MLKRLFVKNTNNFIVQLFRYTFVGGLAFLVDFSALFLLTNYLHIYYLISAAFSFTLGLIVNYFLSVSWVFSKRRLNSRLNEFLIYSFIGLIGLGINELFMWILTENLHFFYLISKIGSTGFVYLWNFSVRRFILFV